MLREVTVLRFPGYVLVFGQCLAAQRVPGMVRSMRVRRGLAAQGRWGRGRVN